MPLQNRVTALGELVASPARGTFTGNRGIIHDAVTQTLRRRRWSTKAWIICVLEFRGRRRKVMSPGTWTELFFLDEVTALAAGHRPCHYCRRADAVWFVNRAHSSGAVESPRAPVVDDVLHRQRVGGAGPRPVSRLWQGGYPDGTVIAVAGEIYALKDGRALPWSLTGYGTPRDFAAFVGRSVRVITPTLTVAALRHGYAPVWHGSAD